RSVTLPKVSSSHRLASAGAAAVRIIRSHSAIRKEKGANGAPLPHPGSRPAPPPVPEPASRRRSPAAVCSSALHGSRGPGGKPAPNPLFFRIVEVSVRYIKDLSGGVFLFAPSRDSHGREVPSGRAGGRAERAAVGRNRPRRARRRT